MAGQAWPQLPQLAAFVVRLISQPFAALPSQLPKPLSQLETWQLPELQLVAALLSAQLLPHWPQCVLVLRRCSQPSPGALLQLP